jgi:hypothetical protein
MLFGSAVAVGAAEPLPMAAPLPEGVKLREVRPFTPAPIKSINDLTTNPLPPGDVLPRNVPNQDTLVIHPGEDPRLTASNRQMVLCREPAALPTRPLVFEDVPLERVGVRAAPPPVQPVVSAAKFFGAFPLVVPRCGQGREERYLGTTEPRYFGPTYEPPPFYLDVSQERAEQLQSQDRSAVELNQTTEAAPEAEPVQALSSDMAEKSVIQTVANNEPVEGLQEVLPGFISNEVEDERGFAYPTTSAPHETVLPASTAAARRVAVQRGQAPTVVPTSTQVATQVATQVSATSPSPTTTYVLYPTADGGFIPVPRENPQIVASQPVVTAQPVAVQAVSVPTVSAPAATVAPPAAQPSARQQPYNPYPTASAIETTVPSDPERVENSRFPLLSHVLLGDSGPAERLPPQQPAAPNLAPPPMYGEQGYETSPANPNCFADGGACAPQCCNTCRPYVGIESTFFAPILGSTPIGVSAFDVTTNYTFNSNTDGLSYMNAAPRVTLGVGSCCGRGARVRYWQMTNSVFGTDALNLADPNDFTGFTSTGEFKVYTIDLEATREFCCCHKTFIGFVGARYVGLSQAESMVTQVLTQPVPDLLTAQATSQTQFYGTGITFGLQCIEPICCKCWGELDFFVGGRGSSVFGTAQSTVASTAQVGGAGIFAATTNQATADNSATLLIGELQTGLQWSKLVCGPCAVQRVFARGSFEYQYWGLSGAPTTQANSFAGRAPFDQISITTEQRDFSNINFVGFTLSVGCYW